MHLLRHNVQCLEIMLLLRDRLMFEFIKAQVWLYLSVKTKTQRQHTTPKRHDPGSRPSLPRRELDTLTAFGGL